MLFSVIIPTYHRRELLARTLESVWAQTYTDYEVIVVDRLLPKRDGLSIVRMLRADHNKTPVLVLSALGEVDDRVAGLRAGGDDYLGGRTTVTAR